MELSVAIITCSSTRTLADDTAGEALAELIIAQGWTVSTHVVVPDKRESISEAIVDASVESDVILTCGGSGLSHKDVTPEATADVCERNVPGIAEAMRAASMLKTRRAMLSRAVCMQRGSTLVINLPGSQKAATECFDAIYDQLEHAVEMTAGLGH
ncbi:MAG: MogA/MoaB family molybdenum cofactor biosynthesis protein [Coriobacteriia bacterium]|nr:MogA/MoaB family molybdenum cofactor biosynthesis protein [Coriobacteriia bacterium]MCL2750858.1 MogA/MoaB family molybdenum cofactor biosynthesis protein [Coriobacteriia bacterium]